MGEKIGKERFIGAEKEGFAVGVSFRRYTSQTPTANAGGFN
jgi:hypothetical protein